MLLVNAVSGGDAELQYLTGLTCKITKPSKHFAPCQLYETQHQSARSSAGPSAQGAATALGRVPSSAASPFPDLGQVSSIPPGAIVHRS